MKTTIHSMKLSAWQLSSVLNTCDYAYADINPANESASSLIVRLNKNDLNSSLKCKQKTTQGVIKRQPMYSLDVYTYESGVKFLVLTGGAA